MPDDDADFGRLMQRLRAGEADAYDVLYSSYGDAIRRAVRQHLHDRLRTQFDSLDFVQDVWASFLALAPERYTFGDPAALGRFLARIARNKVIEVFRSRFQTRAHDITREQPLQPAAGGEMAVAGRESSPSQAAIAQERWDALVRALPDGHRAVVERLREGYTHEEVSQMLGVHVRTIERVVRRLKDLCET